MLLALDKAQCVEPLYMIATILNTYIKGSLPTNYVNSLAE